MREFLGSRLNQENDRRIWDAALLLEGESDLRTSVLKELSEYSGKPKAEVEKLCAGSVPAAARAWHKREREDEASISSFYDEYEEYLYEEASVHNLYRRTDSCFSVLAQMGDYQGKRILDYGSGVGTISLFFAAQGLKSSMADVSGPMLAFCRWRFAKRSWPAEFIDCKCEALPDGRFDYIIAFDVFEHLHDPWKHLKALNCALKPEGMLFVEAPFGHDPDRPMHIVRDSRVLDLAPSIGLETVNCSPYRLRKQPTVIIFRTGQPWGFARAVALLIGRLRYVLKWFKNRSKGVV